MNKVALTIIAVAAIGAMAWIFTADGPAAEGSNVEIKDGVQYITVDARGGYFPQVSTAQSGIPSKLVMKTYNTFDCSASLVIRDLGYRKILDMNSKETIDLGTPEAGKIVQGVCSMGMYSFQVRFN
jgi:plastocyanin domain-containing protein